MHRRIPLLLVLIALPACTRMRFVVDTMPGDEKLTEATVDLGDGDREWAEAKIALLDVTGLIIDAHRPGLISPGENPLGRFTESLRMAARDSDVRAVIIRINSPGGTVTASDAMHREIVHFKETTRKPVVISMADVAASGGYYVACAGDEIIAHPTTITGSIGVIIQTFNFAAGMGRIGIRADAITSGPNKAMGSPFEPMPPEHRELLQGLVDEFYAGFKAIVVASRPRVGADADVLHWVTDGRVVTGRQAAEVGLIDGLGDLRDAFAAAKRRANLPTAKLVKYHRPIEHVGSAYASAPPFTGTQVNFMQLNIDAAAMQQQPGFWYLWDPAAW
jgi:protease IV